MGFWDFMSGVTPAGVASSTVESIGNTLLGGIDKIIRDFKLPPEQMVEYEKFKATAGKELEQIAATDRASARQREIATKDPTTRNLAYFSVGGFYAVLAIQFYFAYANIVIPDSMQRTLDITTGVLFGMVLAVRDYYFGSSRGSDDKTKLLANGK